MINKWDEFICYTGTVDYISSGKKDLAWLHRINPDMLLSGEGFVRVMTIVARGYLWDGEAKDIARARRALCAWCSIPDRSIVEKKDWERKTSFPELHREFPNLVDEEGKGWLIHHVGGDLPLRDRAAGSCSEVDSEEGAAFKG